MAIPVEHESSKIMQEFGKLIESCHFCRTPTRYWHNNTNNPVCQCCSKKHKVSELPDHGKTIRANARKLKKKLVLGTIH